MSTDSPRKKQLAVSRRVRVPGTEASWAQLHEFAATFDASFHLSTSTADVARLAYRPVFAATESGAGIDGELGISLLRAALWFQARSDRLSGASGFTSPEIEGLYRGVCAELHHRTGGWVDDQS